MTGRTKASLCVAMALAALAACGGGGNTPAVLRNYEADAGGSKLTIEIERGENDRVKRAEVVEETTEAVTVKVSLDRNDASGPAIARFETVTVSLAQPLGSRQVRDPNGKPVPSKSRS